MNVIGYEERTIAKLNLPGHWRKVLEDPELDRKAKTIAKFGLLQDPMVRQSDDKLVFGTNRLAGCVKLGIESVTCKIVEATDEEIEAIRYVENYDRFHNEKDRAKKLVDLVNKMAELDTEKVIPKSKGGKTKKGKAREKVAAETGVKPETIRMAEYRKKKKEQLAADPPKLEPTIATLGMELDDDFVVKIATLTGHLKRGAAGISATKAELTRITSAELPINVARIDAIYAQLDDVGAAIAALSPASLCPYCKGLEGITEKCVGCNKTAYVTKDQLGQVPPGFLDMTHPVVLVNGKKVKIEDVIPPEPEAVQTEVVYDDPDPGDEDQNPVDDQILQPPEGGGEGMW